VNGDERTGLVDGVEAGKVRVVGEQADALDDCKRGYSNPRLRTLGMVGAGLPQHDAHILERLPRLPLDVVRDELA